MLNLLSLFVDPTRPRATSTPQHPPCLEHPPQLPARQQLSHAALARRAACCACCAACCCIVAFYHVHRARIDVFDPIALKRMEGKRWLVGNQGSAIAPVHACGSAM